MRLVCFSRCEVYALFRNTQRVHCQKRSNDKGAIKVKSEQIHVVPNIATGARFGPGGTRKKKTPLQIFHFR